MGSFCISQKPDLIIVYYQSDRKPNVTGVLWEDESLKWGPFHQDLSYHSNEIIWEDSVAGGSWKTLKQYYRVIEY